MTDLGLFLMLKVRYKDNMWIYGLSSGLGKNIFYLFVW